MTAPGSYRILPATGPDGAMNFTMSFLVPAVHQEAPPQPTDGTVYIEERPEFSVVAKRFSGFPTERKWIAEASELYDLATGEGLALVEDVLWTAGYDSPAVILFRRNEVWLEMEA